MAMIQLNALRLNAVDANIIALDGVRRRGSHAGAPPVVPDVPDIPDIPEEPDVPSDPDVDENGYIIFADPEVKRVLLANGVGDGVGITPEQAEAVTDIKTIFKDNSIIESFDELNRFGVVKLVDAFANCSSLQSVGLQNIQTVTRSLANGVFWGTKIQKAIMPSITTVGTWGFRGATLLERVFLGSSCTTIREWGFNQCSLLTTLVCIADTPPTLSSNALSSKPNIYVNLNSVEAYKTATNWNAHASRIFPISQLATDNPELYAEIEEYL